MESHRRLQEPGGRRAPVRGAAQGGPGGVLKPACHDPPAQKGTHKTTIDGPAAAHDAANKIWSALGQSRHSGSAPTTSDLSR
jgi:hypothetical protein